MKIEQVVWVIDEAEKPIAVRLVGDTGTLYRLRSLTDDTGPLMVRFHKHVFATKRMALKQLHEEAKIEYRRASRNVCRAAIRFTKEDEKVRREKKQFRR